MEDGEGEGGGVKVRGVKVKGGEFVRQPLLSPPPPTHRNKYYIFYNSFTFSPFTTDGWGKKKQKQKQSVNRNLKPVVTYVESYLFPNTEQIPWYIL